MYDAQLPVLDDEFEGDEVALLAVVGRKVDAHFLRNYAWAKHAADVGKLTKITVTVLVDNSTVAHTVGAVVSALSGQRLHSKAVFDVRPVARGFDVGVAARSVELELASLVAQVEVVEDVKPAPKPVGKPGVKADVKADMKAGEVNEDSGA